MSALSESTVSMADKLAQRIPTNFRLGVATSSWQIEGSSQLRGRSIWDDFASVPGNIKDGAVADPACDHVNRWEQDLELLNWLGVDTYRFSISWPRVLPDGIGKIDQSGLAFYDRLIDGLLARNIEPVITIYHWDLPSALEAKGGWNWDGIGDVFAEYTEVLAKKFADRTAMWATLNEPWCSAFLGYADKVMAPGKADAAAGFQAAYRLLTAHSKSVEVLRQYHAKNVGIVLNLTTFITEDEGAQAAARHMDGIMNRLWLDPLAGRGFPTDIIESTAHLTDWSFVNESELAAVAAPIDWLGINYYAPTRIASQSKPERPEEVIGQRPDAFPEVPPIFFVPRRPLTQMGWEVHPESLITTLKQTQERLPGVPLYITENGGAFPDYLVDGAIDDQARVDYYDRHIQAALTAKEEGVDVRGYFAWSLMDNLEWAEGWTKRFGLFHVDNLTQVRTPKMSAYFYREIISHRKTFPMIG
jgi:beta-glucosidase